MKNRLVLLNSVMPSSYYIYHRVYRKILRSAHTVYLLMSFICLSEQTAIIFVYSGNWLNFITDECVYCAVRSGYLNLISVNLVFKWLKVLPIISIC